MTRIATTSTAATRSLLFATVLLSACAHVPFAGHRDLSGRWEGTSVWTTRLPARNIFRSNFRFTMSLEHQGDEITGTGTVTLADVKDYRPVPANVYGFVQGDRVHLLMVFGPGLDSVGFDGSVRGADRMVGLIYDATAMDLGGWPSKNNIKLKRIGPAHVDPLYPLSGSATRADATSDHPIDR
ncbi:MAG: hypothetical protein P8Z36_07610 [Gemmatimonadota bacterium]